MNKSETETLLQFGEAYMSKLVLRRSKMQKQGGYDINNKIDGQFKKWHVVRSKLGGVNHFYLQGRQGT